MSVHWRSISVIAAAIAVIGLVLPVFGSEHPDADRLRLTSNTGAFYYGEVDPNAAGVIRQNVSTVGSNCEINPLTGWLVTLSSDSGPGGIKGPGLFSLGIGVKSGGSNGTPCSQTSAGEKLTVTSNGNSWVKLELDSEAKGNAWIVAELRLGSELVGTYELVTGASIQASEETPPVDQMVPYEATSTPSDPRVACANASDSGPDSGPNDNCRWIIDHGSRFDSVTLYASVGSLSLEGGADFASFDPSGFANGMYDSLFHRFQNAAPVLTGSVTVPEDGSGTFGGSDLATDADNDPLTVTGASGGTNGTVTHDSVAGTMTYEPDVDFCGTDSFNVSVSDGMNTTTGDVTVNVLCAADDDAYSMDARAEDEQGEVVAGQLVVLAPGVLTNDGNAENLTLISEPAEGELALNTEDGSFSYEAQLRTEEEWIDDIGAGVTSYEVTWTYQVEYPDQEDPQQATVTITVNRNLCELDTVSGRDGDVAGTFTLLSSSGCKTWVPVDADGDAGTVIFQPDSPDTTGVYDGEITAFNVLVEDGSLPNVILTWDPTPEEQVVTDYEPIPACQDLDPDPDVVDPVLQGNPAEPTGWCFYDVDLDLVGDQTFDVTWKVRGWDDPGFGVR